MPCKSDYLEPNETEINASKVLALLEELKTKILPDWYGDGSYKEVYNKYPVKILEKNVPILCEKLRNLDVSQYSLEMQIWWRDHQKADKEREQREEKELQTKTDKEIALSKLTKKEKEILNLT